MNKLSRAGDHTWYLPQHAHIIVHETQDGQEFITIYACGATQRPPSAQLIGNLVRVAADHVRIDQPTGYIAKLRERAFLQRDDSIYWTVRGRAGTPGCSGRHTSGQTE